MNKLVNYINVLNMRVDMVQIPEVVRIMEAWIQSKAKGHYIIISNANDAVLSRRDEKIRTAVMKTGFLFWIPYLLLFYIFYAFFIDI